MPPSGIVPPLEYGPETLVRVAESRSTARTASSVILELLEKALVGGAPQSRLPEIDRQRYGSSGGSPSGS
jgi:hypothetical protein